MSPGVRRVLGGLGGAAAMIAAITVLSRVLGFARILVQAGAFGAGAIGSTYNSANMLPNVVFEAAAGGALAGALVPLLALPVSRALRKDVDAIASAALGWTLLVLVPLGGLLALLAGPIASAWPGLEDAHRELLRYFVTVFAVQVPLYGVAVLLYAVLQAHKRFFWPAFAPVMSSVVVIAVYATYAHLAQGHRDDPAAAGSTALSVLAWGTTAGVAVMCLPMFWPVHRLGVRLRPTLRFPEGVGRRLAALAFAGVGSLVAQQLAMLVAALVSARRGGDGTYSLLLWSQQVYLLPYAVLVVPLATSTFPRLSAHAAAGRRAEYAAMASTTTRAVVLAAGVGAAAVAAAAPAVADVFADLGGDREAISALSPTITLMMPGLVGFAVLFHVSRALYARERGRAAVTVNVLGWGVAGVASVALGAALVPEGHDLRRTLVALAVANSLGMLVGGTAAVVALARAAGRDAVRGLVRTTALVVVAGGVAAVAGRWVVDSVVALLGHDAGSAVGGAAGGAVVALVVMAGAVAVGDRRTVTDMLRVERTPEPVAGDPA
ncbi:murein biosynthesis integral membrane protein MurJ [Cellulomonas fimi]|uniref:Virulence factor MVIN family protein n=1 Tax=Cellulomonas fimi (strain ATCC 484 / DSM 20113 / JCM 1341 / CCUG 24087 / LMG 16345 / NBRC 15513 / NCIMB 8980 / NCTC 7547 / NRS-133) TaxID=590998 RepID=F4H8D2_CELFA|nr:lipid II flippase MurJ [Cellulomonas fimi]AEE45813.1 virulence factor MVIN family protein [Cellulomonas fimi ATCC 484]NNH08958.1 virulence factor MviN [Cellulomonas fimi]VEH30672.1 Probable peptidoglycan biosynthesis protein MurJ [Cellulomonas fimi]